MAKQIARESEACGATPFLDEAQVDAGADFEDDILNFLERAHEKQRGVSVWFDEFDVQPGEPWRDALESALRASDVLVALLDAEYPSKPAVSFELGAAIGMGKKVVPIVRSFICAQRSGSPVELYGAGYHRGTTYAHVRVIEELGQGEEMFLVEGVKICIIDPPPRVLVVRTSLLWRPARAYCLWRGQSRGNRLWGAG